LPNEEILRRFKYAEAYIAKNKEINNILISGGDPLVLESEIIDRFLKVLDRMKNIRFIRIGTRVPVTQPSRLSDSKLLAILRKYSRIDKRLHVVTQFNHPREITPQSIGAVNNLLEAGVLVSNQTVLLRGVNDSPVTLATLLNRLVGVGVVPYYVFQCRPVKRVKHQFQVPLCEGSRIVEKAKAKCNGLSKRFKYIMSHVTGKLEILGIMDNEIYFKYHEAKDRENLGVMFKCRVDEDAGWLDDFRDAKWSSVFKPEFPANLTGAS
jgi:KamA family protein